MAGKYDHPEQPGQISHFQALSAALSAAIGTGNIAGVATAIATGGPGAVFWMWVTAFLGMAIKFSSCLLAVKYRVVDADGSVRGGPMYYIEHGLGPAFKPLALFFALCTAIAALGIGNMVQSNSVADALKDIAWFNTENGVLIFRLAVGLVLALLTALVIVGGIKRIGQVASFLVPFIVGSLRSGRSSNHLYASGYDFPGDWADTKACFYLHRSQWRVFGFHGTGYYQNGGCAGNFL